MKAKGREFEIQTKVSPGPLLIMKSNLNLPNGITLFRFFLGFISLFYFVKGAKFLSFIFIVIFIVLDGIDGYVARQMNQTTALGAVLDPAVDFFIIIGAFVTFYVTKTIATPAFLFIVGAGSLHVIGNLFIYLKYNNFKSEKQSKFAGLLYFLLLLSVYIPAIFTILIYFVGSYDFMIGIKRIAKHLL